MLDQGFHLELQSGTSRSVLCERATVASGGPVQADLRSDPMYQHGLRLLGDTELYARPLFRCGTCSGVFDIRQQWRTTTERYCSDCRPVGATHSASLVIA